MKPAMAKNLKRYAALPLMLAALQACSKCTSTSETSPDRAVELPPPVELSTSAPGLGTSNPSEPETSIDAAPDLEESLASPSPEPKP